MIYPAFSTRSKQIALQSEPVALEGTGHLDSITLTPMHAASQYREVYGLYAGDFEFAIDPNQCKENTFGVPGVFCTELPIRRYAAKIHEDGSIALFSLTEDDYGRVAVGEEVSIWGNSGRPISIALEFKLKASTQGKPKQEVFLVVKDGSTIRRALMTPALRF